MKSKKKLTKVTKKDKDWEKKIEEHLKTEKIELNHPKGKERFEKVIKDARKKKD